MNDVIAPKRSSLIPKLVTSMMFLKLNMSIIPNNLADVVESLIWNTLIPSCLALPDDIDDLIKMKEDDDVDDDNDDDDEDDDQLPVPVESEEADYTC